MCRRKWPQDPPPPGIPRAPPRCPHPGAGGARRCPGSAPPRARDGRAVPGSSPGRAVHFRHLGHPVTLPSAVTDLRLYYMCLEILCMCLCYPLMGGPLTVTACMTVTSSILYVTYPLRPQTKYTRGTLMLLGVRRCPGCAPPRASRGAAAPGGCPGVGGPGATFYYTTELQT